MDNRNDELEQRRGGNQQDASAQQGTRRLQQTGRTHDGQQTGGYQQNGQPHEGQAGGGYQPNGQSHGGQAGGSSYQPNGQFHGSQAGGGYRPNSQLHGSQAGGGYQSNGQFHGSQAGGGYQPAGQPRGGQPYNQRPTGQLQESMARGSQQSANQMGGGQRNGRQADTGHLPTGQRMVNRQSGNQQDIARARAVSKRREEIENLRKERDRKKKFTRRIIAMIVAECFTLAAIFGYAYFARRISLMPRPDVNKKNVINDDLQVADLEKMKGYWMIAVFGVDSRNGSVGAGNQSDVNMICCINQDTGEIRLVSVFRDTYLNTNDDGRYSKFNEAYARGGPEQALKFLNKNLDLNITDYITFSWKAVAEGINLLGGVDLEISKAEFRYINGFITETVNGTNVGSHHLKSAGMNHLDGVQAVAYGRLRLMDTDFARTERQRKIIELAFAKAKQADYPTLNNILVTVLPQVSHNLDFVDLTNVALSISKYHIGETAGFPFARETAVIPGKGDCVIPQTLESNVSELHTFLFGDDGYQPTETVKQISNKISSDTGMYKQGKSVGHVSTEGYLPSETTKAKETTAEETTSEEETDAEGNVTRPSESDGITTVPGIGETDEFGNLVDGPETEDPDDPWPGQNLPGGYNPANPGNPGGQPNQTNPSNPGNSTNPTNPTNPSSPGNIGNEPGTPGADPGYNPNNPGFQDSPANGPGGTDNGNPSQDNYNNDGPPGRPSEIGGPGSANDPGGPGGPGSVSDPGGPGGSTGDPGSGNGNPDPGAGVIIGP